MNEFEVIFKAHNGSAVIAYVYAEDERGAKRQAQAQGIDRNKILSVKYYGRKGKYGHI